MKKGTKEDSEEVKNIEVVAEEVIEVVPESPMKTLLVLKDFTLDKKYNRGDDFKSNNEALIKNLQTQKLIK